MTPKKGESLRRTSKKNFGFSDFFKGILVVAYEDSYSVSMHIYFQRRARIKRKPYKFKSIVSKSCFVDLLSIVTPDCTR